MGANGSGQGNVFSREEILGGQLDRRPVRALAQIETRCKHLRLETRRAIEAYFLSAHQAFTRQFDLNYFQNIKLEVEASRPVEMADLERYAPVWKALAPDDLEARAALIHLLARKYALPRERTVAVQEALGFDDPQVQAAYQERYGQPLETVFAETESAGAPATAEISPEEAALEEAIAGAEWIDLPDGEVLYRQGEAGSSLYILINGRLRLTMQPEEAQEPQIVRELSRGELVGATEVLTGEQRDATVTAIRDSELVRLPQEALNRLAEKHPQVMLRLNQILAQRLRLHLTGQAQPQAVPLTFALVPIAADDEMLAGLAQRLTRSLGVEGPALLVTAERVEAELGRGMAQTGAHDPQNGQLAAWLSGQETKSRYVVYQAERQATEWTRRCIRQADLVLWVADATAEPKVTGAERKLRDDRMTARQELVLVQPEGTSRPSGTRQWLEPRQVQAHHHLRLGVEEDTNRLVRRLTGRAVGLVLGGGGARGFAHIGVYEALREAGFQVDLLGGTSMGSILGGAYAMGMTTAEVMEVVRKFSSPFKLFDPTLPVVSFFSSEKFSKAMREIFGSVQIEDLWRPFFCISSSLTRAMQVVHKTGPLWQAVRASAAIPGVFSPVLYENELLVDGAVLNNLPTDVMREFSQGGPVIAINVIPEIDLVKEYRFGDSVSGWSALINKFNPLAKDFEAPLIFENLLRVIALNDVHHAKAKRETVDLYIRPPVERYNILDFRSYEPIIGIGFETAKSEILAWKQAGQNSRLAQSLPPTPTRRLSQALQDLEAALEGV